MGLDMYLNIHTRWYDYGDGILVKKPHPGTDVNKVETVKVIHEVYWRKANQIHNWFVENVQDGDDDCREYDVATSDIEKLLYTCNRVINEICKVDKYLHLDKRYVNKYRNSLKKQGFMNASGKTLDDEIENLEEKIPINFDLLTNYDITPHYYRLTKKQSEIAKSILPTRDGFFFGTTVYGGHYITDILDTIKKLEKVLNSDYRYLTYCSSW
jgi:hypothetical protein